jgi:putative aldouronate transport system substrate-binding protein
MKTKRILALLLSLAVSGSILAGCSNSDKKDAEKTSETSTEAPVVNTTESWKTDTSPHTIDWFVEGDWYNKKWDSENNTFDKMVTTDTGITINMMSGNTDKFNALIASNSLPDMITASHASSSVQMLQQSGQVWALDELAKEYAPNMRIPKSMLSWHGQEDGHLYGYINYFYATENIKEGESVPVHTEMMARKDIMEQLGINPSEFETKQGTINALKKVKDAKLKYNGFDVIPAYFDVNNLMQFFGADREDKDGNYIDRQFTAEAKESIKFLNQLYREGLMPSDSLTLNTEQLRQKIGQGSVFAFSNHLLAFSALNSLYNADNNAWFVGIGPIKGDSGKPFYFDPSPMAGWTATMINKKAKKPERIIRFFDYMTHDDEMSLNAHHGVKGVTWEYDSNNRVKYIDSYVSEKNADSAKASLKYDATFEWFIDWMPIQRTWPVASDPSQKAHDDSDAAYGKYWYNDLAFSMVSNPATGTDEAATYTKVNDYINQQNAKIILAKSDSEFEDLYNERLEQVKKLGYDDLYKWQNEQFKAAKAKLGVDFAWPANK